MKWSLQQLHKIQKYPYEFEEELEFNEEVSAVSDIYEIKRVLVKGTIDRIGDDTYRFKYHLIADMVLQCALTLDPVDYRLEDDYEEVYSDNPSEDENPIEKNTIDTRIMVWSNIVVDKPINVSRPDAYEILKERGISLDDTIELDKDEEIISYNDFRLNDQEEGE